MDTLPDIHGATAVVRDTKELLQQVSVDLSEERSCWSISLTCSDLGGENYHANHELYKRLFRAKQGDKPVTVSIVFQEAEMNLEQAQMFPPDDLPIAGISDRGDNPEDPGDEIPVIDVETPPWDQETGTTGDEKPRTYKVNGEEHEYGGASTEPEGSEGSPEQQQEFNEAAADGAPEEFQEPAPSRSRRRRNTSSAVVTSESPESPE